MRLPPIARGCRRSAAAACAAFALAGLLATGVARAADTPDPRGLPAPYTGPPLTTATPGEVDPWTRLKHQPWFSPGVMLLMTDGTVLVQDNQYGRWYALVPNRRGSYVDGRWHAIASAPNGYAPLYFASDVLPDGRVFIMGGEYDDNSYQQSEMNEGAVYDPQRNTWTAVAPPTGWTNVGDAQSVLLNGGRVLLANNFGFGDALLNTSNFGWTPTGMPESTQSEQQGFSLLPDGRVLTVDTSNQGSELFDPATGSWSSAGTVPVQLVDSGSEQGPLVSSPDGNVFAVGATGNTAIYHFQRGRPGWWSIGPKLPNLQGFQLVADDAAGARLPDGKALIAAGQTNYKSPTHFFLFDGRHLKRVDDNSTASKVASYNTRMLVLPTGEVLYDDWHHVYVFRSSGKPHDGWRPVIRRVPRHLARGRTYRLSGLQLAGRDQGAAYGDDFQDNTNYPLVRIVNQRSKKVTYARTTGWSPSTAADARSTTDFALPRDIPRGKSRLVVVANGIASEPVAVTVTG